MLARIVSLSIVVAVLDTKPVDFPKFLERIQTILARVRKPWDKTSGVQ